MKENEVELTIVAQINQANPDTVLAPRYEIAVADFENGDKISMCALLSGSLTFEFNDGTYLLLNVNNLFSTVIDYKESIQK